MQARCFLLAGLLLSFAPLVACGDDSPAAVEPSGTASSSSGGSGGAAGVGGEGGASAAGSGGSVDKAASCASTFGDQLGSLGFARFDGTVAAVVRPGNESCAMPNSSHTVVQIEMKGAVYRMVINVKSDQGIERRIFTAETSAPLPGEPWADGWHTASLDYAADLQKHSADFAPREKDEASAWIEDALQLGARVSVFGTADSKPESAHLIHRNSDQHDGALVVDPTGDAPRWLLFRFDEQAF